MHELSIASAVLASARRHAAGRPLAVVRLRVGALRQVVPGSLTFYWEVVAPDVRLEQQLVPLRVRCEECGAEWEPAEPAFRCRTCGGEARPITGEELEIESIDVEEVPCTA
jgi:hydrogenase nickel incorporation protein HypA/HybF